MVVRYVLQNSFLPLLSLYISCLYLFRRFVGCAAGCLAFWVTGAISFSLVPFWSLLAFIWADWLSLWNVCLFMAFVWFDFPGTGFGRSNGWFFCVFTFLQLSPLLTFTFDFRHHSMIIFTIANTLPPSFLLSLSHKFPSKLFLLETSAGAPLSARYISNMTFPSFLSLPLPQDDHFFSLTCFCVIIRVYTLFFTFYPWYIAF